MSEFEISPARQLDEDVEAAVPSPCAAEGGHSCPGLHAAGDAGWAIRPRAGRFGLLARGLLVAVLAAGIAPLAACSSSDEGTTAAGEASSSSDASDELTLSEIAEIFDASLLDLEYTNRDQDPSYDEADSTIITLEGSSASIEGDGASTEGSTVVISAEGTYVVSGLLDDGQLVVEVTEDEKVQVVLAGVSIHNEDGPAIYVKEADKCFITLADGTDNVLTDGESYELEEDSDEPYATLFSRADLTINGSGSLSVTSSYRHAVCSKDDLVITGGAYTINAVEDALRGRDCVKILDGSFDVTAGGDGIKSNKDDDAERGFVSIDGGSFSIVAGDDGVQAVTYLRVTGGTMSVESYDDAFHSDLEMLISGGELEVQAGDDAFHAETVLTIDGGTIDVVSCYEGYEAEKIYVNGGTTHIVASDDGINASAADLSEDSDSSTTSDASTSAADGFAADAGGEMPSDAGGGTFPNAGGGGFADTDSFSGDFDERAMGGGAPDNAFAESAPGVTMGDENCLIQINGGYTVVDASGDGVDSNGSIEVTGGVLLVSGASNSDDAALDYDLTATISGGTVVLVGGSGMAQNFTEGTQPFSYASVSGSAGATIAVTDADGEVLASFESPKQFSSVVVSCASFEEGESYTLVIGGEVSGVNEDGYTDGSTVTGGTSTEITASTTASGGFGGLGVDGNPMGAGQAGDVQMQRREHF